MGEIVERFAIQEFNEDRKSWVDMPYFKNMRREFAQGAWSMLISANLMTDKKIKFLKINLEYKTTKEIAWWNCSQKK